VTFDFGEYVPNTSSRSWTWCAQRAANTALPRAQRALVVATLMGMSRRRHDGSRRSGLLTRLIRGASLVPAVGAAASSDSLVLVTIAARTGWLPVSGMEGPASFVGADAPRSRLPIRRARSSAAAVAVIREALQRPSTHAPPHRAAFRRALWFWRHGWRQSLGHAARDLRRDRRHRSSADSFAV
jgi:hypothetical protein